MDKKTSGANDPLKKGDKNMEIFRTSCDLRKGICIQYKAERRLKPGADGTVWTAEKAQDCLCLEVFCNNKGQYPCSGLIDNTPKKKGSTRVIRASISRPAEDQMAHKKPNNQK